MTTQGKGGVRACTVAPVHSVQQFRVFAADASGPLPDIAVAITPPSGVDVRPRVAPLCDARQRGYSVEFSLSELGDHVVDIVLGGEVIRNSGGLPYRVRCVLPPGAAADRVKAHGAGLAGGTAGLAAEFVIDTRGAGPGGLGVTVEGPSEAAIQCRDNGDGTCSVAYLPVTSGDYLINVTFNGQRISRAPFAARVVDDPAARVRVHGPGVQRDHGNSSATRGKREASWFFIRLNRLFESPR